VDQDFKKIRVLTDKDSVIELLRLIEKGYSPAYELKKGKYITRRGSLKFKFIKPTQLNSRIFKTLDYIFKAAGPLNVWLNEMDEYIKVEVKLILLKLEEASLELTREYESLLKSALVEGKVINLPKGLIIESDLEIIQLNVPSELKRAIVESAWKDD
jgi:hypothetical protein